MLHFCKHRTWGSHRSPVSCRIHSVKLLIKRSGIIFHNFKSLSMFFLPGLFFAQMIKLTQQQTEFYSSACSLPKKWFVIEAVLEHLASPEAALQGEKLSVFSSLHIIDPISTPEIVYWHVQGWTPLFNANGCTKLPDCWLEWFHEQIAQAHLFCK